MTLTKEALRAYLSSHSREDFSQVRDDDELFSTGVVDSFVMVELLLFLEQHTGAKLGPEDINLDNLDSIARIMEFAAARAKHR
ncbi:MAG: acyl carrier protein [Myxococcales bacterium]|nr:acyl carrier protein [Myxococcales bacterium]